MALGKGVVTLPTITGNHADMVAVLTNGSFATAAIDGGSLSLENGGGSLRFYTDETKTVGIPCHPVKFVVGASPSIQVWIKIPNAFTGATIYVEEDPIETSQPALTAPLGRNAVYSGEINRMHMESASPIDSSGNQNSIIANSVTLDMGNIGGALRFNGASSHIDLGASILPFGDFTQNVWINPDDLNGYQGIMGNWVSPEDGRTYIGLKGEEYNWDGYATSSNVRGTATALVWQMLTVRSLNGVVTISRDSVQQGSTITDLGTPNTAHNTFIGALTQGTNNFFDGLIGDNFILNNAISDDYLSTIFENQNNPDSWATMGEWTEQDSEVLPPVYSFHSAIGVNALLSANKSKAINYVNELNQNTTLTAFNIKSININASINQNQALQALNVKCLMLSTELLQGQQLQAAKSKKIALSGEIQQSYAMQGFFQNGTTEIHQFNATISVTPKSSGKFNKSVKQENQISQRIVLTGQAIKRSALQLNIIQIIALASNAYKHVNVNAELQQNLVINAIFFNAAQPLYLRKFRINGEIVFQRFNGATVKQRFNGALN